jgi:hypothetical protein
MDSNSWKGKTGFQLPPGVSYKKQRLSDAWVLESAMKFGLSHPARINR